MRAESFLHRYGYLSSPHASRGLNLGHHVINYTQGFRADNGTQTNTIERFRANLKNTMHKESGVKREDIVNWLDQNTFIIRRLMHATHKEFSNVFIFILKRYF